LRLTIAAWAVTYTCSGHDCKCVIKRLTKLSNDICYQLGFCLGCNAGKAHKDQASE